MAIPNISLGLSDATKEVTGTWKSTAIAADNFATGYEMDNLESYNIGLKGRTAGLTLAQTSMLKNLDYAHLVGGVNVDNHNMTERAIGRAVYGDGVVRPTFRCAGGGDRAASAFSIAAPTGSWSFLARLQPRQLPGTSGQPVILYFWDGVAASPNIGWRLMQEGDGDFWFQVYHYTSLTTLLIAKASVPQYEAYDLALRYNHSTVKADVWINGAQVVAPTTVAAAVAHASNQISYGASGQVGRHAFLAGEMWTRYLSDAEVVAWKAERRTGKENGLLFAHGFREGTGSTVADDGPGGYTLTKTGGEWISVVDTRRVEQDGHDSGEVQVYHSPPRVTALEQLGGADYISSPASITYPRSVTVDIVCEFPEGYYSALAGQLVSVFKASPHSDALVTFNIGTGGDYLLAKTFRGGSYSIQVHNPATLRTISGYRHFRVIVDGEANQLRAFENGIECAPSPVAIGTYTADVTGSLIRVGGSQLGAWITHATVREGVWTDAADMALGWRPRPRWTPGLIAQIEFVGGVPKDTGPNAYTLTPTGSPTYIEVDNPDPNATYLPRALYGRRDESRPLAAYPKRLVIDSSDGTSTISNVTATQLFAQFHDPYNPDGYIEIGHLGFHELFSPTYGRIRANAAARQNRFGSVNRTPSGVVWSPRTNRPSSFDFTLSTLVDDEAETLLAAVVRQKANTAEPILVIDRSRPSQPLIDRVYWGTVETSRGLDDPGPSYETMDVSITNVEDYGNG